MEQGRRVPSPALQEVRDPASRQRERLPERLRSLDTTPSPYPVEIAPALHSLAAEVDRATQCSPSSSSFAAT
jgi:hypothetical protein